MSCSCAQQHHPGPGGAGEGSGQPGEAAVSRNQSLDSRSLRICRGRDRTWGWVGSQKESATHVGGLKAGLSPSSFAFPLDMPARILILWRNGANYPSSNNSIALCYHFVKDYLSSIFLFIGQAISFPSKLAHLHVRFTVWKVEGWGGRDSNPHGYEIQLLDGQSCMPFHHLPTEWHHTIERLGLSSI